MIEGLLWGTGYDRVTVQFSMPVQLFSMAWQVYLLQWESDCSFSMPIQLFCLVWQPLLAWHSNCDNSLCHDRATSLWYMTDCLVLLPWQSNFTLVYDRLSRPFAMIEHLHFGITDCLVLLLWQSNFTLVWQYVSSFYHDRATLLWYDRLPRPFTMT